MKIQLDEEKEDSRAGLSVLVVSTVGQLCAGSS